MPKKTQHIHNGAQQRYQQNLTLAKQLLADYQKGDEKALKRFREAHPDGEDINFTPTLQDARLIISGSSVRIKNLSLEQLKKQAKGLLKGIKLGQDEALSRLKKHHPKGRQIQPDIVKLADAQAVIARENSLPSWAKLKHHFELITQAKQHLKHPYLPLDHDLKTLHIRCGSDIKHAIQTAGFKGDFLEVNNPFPQGQVPPFDPITDFVKIRSDFLIRSYMADIPPEYAEQARNSDQEILRVEQQLRALPQSYQRIVLWFEHDPFDQLCFAYLLAHIAECKLQTYQLELVQVDRFPGIKKFIGIGYLGQHPEGLITLWQQRCNITPAMVAFGARCWHAYTAQTPLDLWQLSQAPSPLPIMQKAMIRILKELPWLNSGLGLTEQLALEIIARDGPINMAKAFHFLNTEAETSSYLGDIMFLYAMRPFWQGGNAPLTVTHYDPQQPSMQRETVTITTLGNSLLSGEKHWLEHCPEHYQRWLGNTLISPEKTNWHWDPKGKKPVYIE